jgi:hypothetical protein
MVHVPNDIPPTTPVDALTVPMAGLLLLQVPPAGVVDKVVVAPRQAMFTPVMAAGVGVTVTTATELQPATVYMIVDVPGEPPVTIPDEEPTVAIPVDVLLHVPPPEVLDRVVL